MKLIKKCVIVVFILLIFCITTTESMYNSSFLSWKDLIQEISPCGTYEVEIILQICSLPFAKDGLYIRIRNLKDTEHEYMGGYLEYGSFFLNNKNKDWTEDDYSFSWIEGGFIFDFHGKYQDPIAYEVHWEDVDGLEMIFYD